MPTEQQEKVAAKSVFDLLTDVHSLARYEMTRKGFPGIDAILYDVNESEYGLSITQLTGSERFFVDREQYGPKWNAIADYIGRRNTTSEISIYVNTALCRTIPKIEDAEKFYDRISAIPDSDCSNVTAVSFDGHSFEVVKERGFDEHSGENLSGCFVSFMHTQDWEGNFSRLLAKKIKSRRAYSGETAFLCIDIPDIQQISHRKVIGKLKETKLDWNQDFSKVIVLTLTGRSAIVDS